MNCWVKLTSSFVFRDPFTRAWNKNIWLWHLSHRSQDIEHYRFTKLARYKFQPDRELMRSPVQLQYIDYRVLGLFRKPQDSIKVLMKHLCQQNCLLSGIRVLIA